MAKILIKIGSNLLTREDNSLKTELLESICKQIAELHQHNHQIGIVTSGAVAAGRHDYKNETDDEDLITKQLLAAIGQCRLLDKYHDYLSKYKLTIAQALLTNRDFDNIEHKQKIGTVLTNLLKKGYIPIINENDVTSTAELKIENDHFGDNDMLSAKTAVLIQADQLIILTDVEGLYNCNPKTNQTASILHQVENLDQNIFCLAEEHQSQKSRGGMQTKLKAAKLTTENGIETFIANGARANILIDLLIYKKENIGTKFLIQKPQN